uniref:Uncharacterized protein n=1 Tax=Rhodnius prolixus TaxID=13249 RepID=T1HDL9_RHOPR
MPPTRWEASQRPLFVKTVWIAGARHAILSQDDPARRCPTIGNPARRSNRRACSAPAVKSSSTRARNLTAQSTIEACLSNRSLETPAEESPRPNQFTERVYQWLEAAGKVRPPTPFEGALWESPRGELLDLNGGPLRLATKNVELNVSCASFGTCKRTPTNSADTRSPSPGLVQTFSPPKQITARPSTTGTRPQLHIFMPLVQAMQRPSIDTRL